MTAERGTQGQTNTSMQAHTHMHTHSLLGEADFRTQQPPTATSGELTHAETRPVNERLKCNFECCMNAHGEFLFHQRIPQFVGLKWTVEFKKTNHKITRAESQTECPSLPGTLDSRTVICSHNVCCSQQILEGRGREWGGSACA